MITRALNRTLHSSADEAGEQQAKAVKLDAAIAATRKELGYGG